MQHPDQHNLNVVAMVPPPVTAAIQPSSYAMISQDTDTENTAAHQDDKLFLKSTGFNGDEPSRGRQPGGSSLLMTKNRSNSRILTSHVVPEQPIEEEDGLRGSPANNVVYQE